MASTQPHVWSVEMRILARQMFSPLRASRFALAGPERTPIEDRSCETNPILRVFRLKIRVEVPNEANWHPARRRRESKQSRRTRLRETNPMIAVFGLKTPIEPKSKPNQSQLSEHAAVADCGLRIRGCPSPKAPSPGRQTNPISPFLGQERGPSGKTKPIGPADEANSSLCPLDAAATIDDASRRT